MASGDDDTEDDDVAPYAAPPPAPDRTWRHPAEYAMEARRRAQRRRRNRRVAGLAIGSVVGAGVIATVGLRSDPAPTVDAPAVVRTTDPPPPTTDPLAEWARQISAEARASTVVVQSPAGTSAIALAVAVGPDGILVTSNRALEGQTSFVVHTQAGTAHTAQLLGGDPDTDVAVLEVDGVLPVAPTAQAAPAAGDQVAVVDGGGEARADAIAHDTVITEGDDGEKLVGLFSLAGTDAAALAGSPIVDADGAITGIAAHTADDASAGVPIGVAVRVAEEIIESGAVEHPWLGVSLADLGPAAVTAVVDGGPASLAGISPDDVIRAVDGRPIDDAAALVATLLALQPGHRVELAIDRDGEALTVWFDLGSRSPKS